MLESLSRLLGVLVRLFEARISTRGISEVFRLQGSGRRPIHMFSS